MRIIRLLIVLLVAALPIQIGLHFWPQWAFVHGRRIDYLSPTIYFTDCIVLAIVSAHIVLRFVNPGIRNVRKKFVFTRYRSFSLTFIFLPLRIFNSAVRWVFHRWTRIVFCGIALFAVINTTISVSPMISVYKWVKVLEMVILAGILRTYSFSVRNVTTAFVVSITIASGIGIIQSLTGHSVHPLLWLIGERMFSIDTHGVATATICVPLVGCREMLRAYATFPHPNVLGMYIASAYVLLGIFAIIPAYDIPARIYRSFVVGIGMFFGLSLLLTMSRSAVVSLFIAAGAIIAIPSRMMISRFLLLFLAFVIVTVLICVFQIRPISAVDESVYVRRQLNESASVMIRTAPFIGSGLGGFIPAVSVYPVVKTIQYMEPVHSCWILIFAETGIIGITLVSIGMWLWFKSFLYSLRDFRRMIDKDRVDIDHWLRIGWGVIFLMCIAVGFVDHFPLTLQQGMLLLTVSLALSKNPHDG